jgi:DNA polymerase
MTDDRTKAARELLAFYLEAGVDAVVAEAPVDRFADAAAAPLAVSSAPGGETDRRSRSPEPRRPQPTLDRSGVTAAAKTAGSGGAPPPSPDAAAMAAREAAKSAQSLDELRAILERFEGCALKATATQLAFADGNPQGRVMFVGEAPGREEDLAGLPFVGRSGKLLDRMMAAIGLDRTSVYIANIVPWRPPGNRTPTPVEMQICLPFIQRQIELADPDILVCVGQPSSAALLNVQGIMKNRGRWFPYHTGRREIRAMPILHPAYLLRQPLAKRHAWRDFLAIKKALEG